MLGHWALERGQGGRRVPTEDKGPSVDYSLWVLASTAASLARVGVGWLMGVTFPQPEMQQDTSWPTPGPSDDSRI